MSNQSTSIVVAGSPEAPTTTISLSLKASEFIESSIEKSEAIISVDSQSEQQAATSICAVLKGLASEIEKSREDFKKPYLEAGRAIDDFAKSKRNPILEESKRLEKLIGDYVKAEQAKIEKARREEEARVAEAKRKLEEEARQAEELKRKAEQAEAEAERLKKAAEEAKGKAAKAVAEKAAAEAAEAAKLASEKSDEAQIAASFQEQPEQQFFADKKVEGASVKTEYTAEVIDVAALYRAFPQFVKLSVENALLKAYINTPGAQLKIPGVIIKEETKVATKKVASGLLNQLQQTQLPQ